MNKLRVLSALLYVLITLPIWYFLFYKILEYINASELMWFLYWIYLPVSFVSVFITRVIDKD